MSSSIQPPATEHFCLKWNNFQTNILSALVSLKLDEDFVDVTLSCEGQTIKAHKVILSACSDYFRDVFRENPCTHPVVILRDADFVDVEGLVRYVYRGEVDVRPERLSSFLRTAELLKIKGLADQSVGSKNNEEDQEQNESEVEEEDEEVPAPVVLPTISPISVPTLGYRPNLEQPQQLPPTNLPSSSPTMLPNTSGLTQGLVSTPTTAVNTTINKVIPSPIRVPVPPTSSLHHQQQQQLQQQQQQQQVSAFKRTHFSNLAQYLAGGHVTSPPPHQIIGDTPASPASAPAASAVASKRRKTIPRKKSDTNNPSSTMFFGMSTTSATAGSTSAPRYSGSTSSLTASPASPPRSHSTEGEGPLEICEESDRESGRSSESTESSLKSIHFGFSETTRLSGQQQHHLLAYHHHQLQLQQQQQQQQQLDCDEPRLVIEDTVVVDDEDDAAEDGLDLSRHRRQPRTNSDAAKSISSSSITSTASDEVNATVLNPNVNKTAIFSPLQHITSPNRDGRSVSKSESFTSRASLASISPAASVTSNVSNNMASEKNPLDAQNQALDCSVASRDNLVIRRPKAIKANGSINNNNRKQGGKNVRQLQHVLADAEALQPQQQQQQQHIDDDDDQQQQHPRNRWRCMQPRLCNYCWKTFSNSFNLKQHIVNVHIQSQGVACSLCSKVVKNKWYLRKHLVTAHGAPLKRIKPDTAGSATNVGNGSSKKAKKAVDMTLSSAMMSLATAAATSPAIVVPTNGEKSNDEEDSN